MAQGGFFDVDKRLEQLSAAGDALENLQKMVPWEAFRPLVEAALERKDRSAGGRPPYDAVLMFKIVVLQSLYNLSDDQTEYQIRDRLSFMRFLGFGLYDRVPDAKTVWLFRERLTEAGAIRKLFDLFDGYLNRQGFTAKGGQIIDATIVPVPRQNQTKEERDGLKRGIIPEKWQEKEARLRQKDTDATWTRKNNRNYYGYKNHVGVDAGCKIIRRYDVTDAAFFDGHVFQELLDDSNDSKDVYADSAYRSSCKEQLLEEKGFVSQIHERAQRNHPLTEAQEENNKRKSKTRARVEHIFGYQVTALHGVTVKTIGLSRAQTKIGLKNLAYNLRRFVFLLRQQPKTSPA